MALAVGGEGVIQLSIESMTGSHFTLEVEETENIGTIKRLIWESEGIPPYHQGLVHHGAQLVDSSDFTLKDLGLRHGSRLQLIVLARSGPLSLIPPSSSAHISRPLVSKSPRQAVLQKKKSSELDSEDTADLDYVFTQEREFEARKRADENMRTKTRMRELQQNIEKMKLRNIGTRGGSVEQSSSRGTEPSCATSSRNGDGSTVIRFNGFLSAPEDTSAKESSAGETEYEGSTASSLRDEFREIVRKEEDKSAANPSVSARQKTSASCPTTRLQPKNLLGRVMSSSSEPESSGAIWTGSDAEAREAEEELFTADEEMKHYELLGSLDEDFFTGISGDELSTRPLARAIGHSLDDELDTDASELSSGMIVCALSHDHRRPKQLRKKHYVNSVKNVPKQKGQSILDSTTDLESGKTARRSAVELQSCSWKARTAVDSKNRPRFKTRPTGPQFPQSSSAYVIATAPRYSTTGESSSDEREKESGNAVPKRSSSLGVPFLQYHQVPRKTTGLAGLRSSKYRGVVENPVRNHKLPQSSQSQQRCMACGYRLTLASTFQCRCGKALCSRHKAPEMHTCSYDACGRPKTHMKTQEVSD